MSKEFSEDKLIQRSAAELLEKELGWTSVYAFDKDVLGVNGTLGRTSYHEVLLTERFRKALKTLNSWLTDKTAAGVRGAHDGAHEQPDADANQRAEVSVHQGRCARDPRKA